MKGCANRTFLAGLTVDAAQGILTNFGVVAALHGVDFQLKFFPVLRDSALTSHQRPETQTPQIYAEVAVGDSPPPRGERRAAVVARGVEPHHALEAPRAVVDCVATRFE